MGGRKLYHELKNPMREQGITRGRDAFFDHMTYWCHKKEVVTKQPARAYGVVRIGSPIYRLRRHNKYGLPISPTSRQKKDLLTLVLPAQETPSIK